MLIDDDVESLDSLERLLQPLSPQIFCAGSANALRRFDDTAPDLIILERSLRGLDGLQLLHRLRSKEGGSHVPVVVRADCDSTRDTREAIDAGAAYCVARPLDERLLLAVVTGILRTAGRLGRRREPESPLLAHLREGRFEFRTLEDVQGLAFELSQLCPQPECVAMALAELMLNAVEHGNLEITYEEKSLLCRQDGWRAEVEHRLRLPKYRDRRANIHVQRTPDAVLFRITDEGAGFSWQGFMSLDQQRSLDPNGRGIALARELAFRSLRYEGRGNIVTAEVPVESV